MASLRDIINARIELAQNEGAILSHRHCRSFDAPPKQRRRTRPRRQYKVPKRFSGAEAIAIRIAKNHGLTYRDMATRLHCSTETLHKICKGVGGYGV